MTTTRREFVERMAVGAALAGGIPLTSRIESGSTKVASLPKDVWDLSWSKRVESARHRAVFDSPQIESGLGMMRAGIWKSQVHEVQGIPLADIAAVSILRHEGIVLAMQQSFWDEYGVGASKKVTDMRGSATDKNPVLVDKNDGELHPMMADSRLQKFIAGGGIVLACNLAFEMDVISIVMQKTGIQRDAARKSALAMLVPGVILQPSGVFAVVIAQETGAKYVGLS